MKFLEGGSQKPMSNILRIFLNIAEEYKLCEKWPNTEVFLVCISGSEITQ